MKIIFNKKLTLSKSPPVGDFIPRTSGLFNYYLFISSTDIPIRSAASKTEITPSRTKSFKISNLPFAWPSAWPAAFPFDKLHQTHPCQSHLASPDVIPETLSALSPFQSKESNAPDHQAIFFYNRNSVCSNIKQQFPSFRFLHCDFHDCRNCSYDFCFNFSMICSILFLSVLICSNFSIKTESESDEGTIKNIK